jgi:trimethylamine corrinoid protein
MKAAVQTLEPEMAKRGVGRQSLGTVVLATIEGDIHDIGKSLVGTMLSVAGFKVFDLGVDVPILTLIEKARDEHADIIGVSALLTTTMVKQRDMVEALEDMGLHGSVKVIVGGRDRRRRVQRGRRGRGGAGQKTARPHPKGVTPCFHNCDC